MYLKLVVPLILPEKTQFCIVSNYCQISNIYKRFYCEDISDVFCHFTRWCFAHFHGLFFEHLLIIFTQYEVHLVADEMGFLRDIKTDIYQIWWIQRAEAYKLSNLFRIYCLSLLLKFTLLLLFSFNFQVFFVCKKLPFCVKIKYSLLHKVVIIHWLIARVFYFNPNLNLSSKI